MARKGKHVLLLLLVLTTLFSVSLWLLPSLDVFPPQTAIDRAGNMAHPVAAGEKGETDLQPYISQLALVLGHSYNFPHGATKVLDFLYLTSMDEAANLTLIKELGVTHVINCAATYCNTGQKFYGPKIRYVEFEAEDDEDYNMIQHFEAANELIEDARKTGGKALIHCIMGINRSGVLTAAYVMLHKNWGPITAAKFVKKARKIVLTNDGFQKQLLEFASERGRLDKSELNMKVDDVLSP